MDLCATRKFYRRDDKHLPEKPRGPERAIHHRLCRTHRLPMQHRRHSQVPLPHPRRTTGRIRLHPRRRKGHPVCEQSGWLQNGMPLLHDGTPRFSGQPFCNGHPEPDIFVAREGHTNQRGLYGTRRTLRQY